MPLIYEFIPFDISLFATDFPSSCSKSIQESHACGFESKKLHLQSETLFRFIKWMNSFGFQIRDSPRSKVIKHIPFDVYYGWLQYNNVAIQRHIMCSTSRLKYGFNASSTRLQENGFAKCQYERMTTIWIRLLWTLNATILSCDTHTEIILFNKLRGIWNFEIGMSEVLAPRWIMDNGTPRWHNYQH